MRHTDGSGSTFIDTAHLNAICSGGYGPVGNDFPTAATGSATLIGACGDDGIASAIAANKGAIGYVAPSNLVPGETSAAIQNEDGQYTPTAAAITAAFTSTNGNKPPTSALPTRSPASRSTST